MEETQGEETHGEGVRIDLPTSSPEVSNRLKRMFMVPMGTLVEIEYGGIDANHLTMDKAIVAKTKISGRVNHNTGFIFEDNTFVFGIDIISPPDLEGKQLYVYSIRDKIKNLPKLAPGFQLSKDGTKIIQTEKRPEADPSTARSGTTPRPRTPLRSTTPPSRSPTTEGGSRKKKNTKRKRRSIHKRSLKKRLSKKRLSKKRLSKKRLSRKRRRQNKSK